MYYCKNKRIKTLIMSILLVIFISLSSPLPAQTTQEHSYISVPTLVMVYKNYRKEATDADLAAHLDDAAVDTIEEQILRLREFFWRNSHLKYNMEFKDPTNIILEIDREINLDQCAPFPTTPVTYMLDGNTIDGTNSVYKDIIDNNLDPLDFSTIIVLYAWKDLPGAKRWAAGMAAYVYSYGYGNCLLSIPVVNERILFEGLSHEYSHLIDHMFQYNKINPYPSVDNLLNEAPGWTYGQADEIYSRILRHWPVDDWFLQSPLEWGHTRTAVDNDMDGVPDYGVDGVGNPLAITELTLGSSVTSADTDGDTLTDLQEVMAHWNKGADPLDSDSDDDGVTDDLDYYPSYAYPYIIPSSNPVINGTISAGEHTLFNHATSSWYDLSTYVDWNDDYLFLSFFLANGYTLANLSDKTTQFKLMMDLNNDGQFYGLDNYLITFGFDSNNTPSLFAGRMEEGAMDWTDGGTVLPTGDFQLVGIGNDIFRSIELAIPRTAIPELNPGEGQYLNMHLLIKMRDGAVGWEDCLLDGFTGTYEQRFEFIRFIMADNPVGVARFMEDEVIFNDFPLFETDTKTIQIKNWGNGPLDINGFTSTNPHFSVENLPLSIGPMETGDIVISYTPEITGHETGSITLQGFVPSLDETPIALFGTGVIIDDSYVSNHPWVDSAASRVFRDSTMYGAPLMIGGEEFEKGLGMLVVTNDPAYVTLNTDTLYDTFSGKLGVNENVRTGYYVEFRILDDSYNPIYTSPAITGPGDAVEVSVDISDVHTLTLKAFIIGPGLGVYHEVVWGNAELLIDSTRECTCPAGCGTPVSITPDFIKDGTDEVCFETEDLGDYFNSWNLEALEVNGVTFTNQYITADQFPSKINGKYYVYYKSNYPWGHFEAKNN